MYNFEYSQERSARMTENRYPFEVLKHRKAVWILLKRLHFGKPHSLKEVFMTQFIDANQRSYQQNSWNFMSSIAKYIHILLISIHNGKKGLLEAENLGEKRKNNHNDYNFQNNAWSYQTYSRWFWYNTKTLKDEIYLLRVAVLWRSLKDRLGALNTNIDWSKVFSMKFISWIVFLTAIQLLLEKTSIATWKSSRNYSIITVSLKTYLGYCWQLGCNSCLQFSLILIRSLLKIVLKPLSSSVKSFSE